MCKTTFTHSLSDIHHLLHDINIPDTTHNDVPPDDIPQDIYVQPIVMADYTPNTPLLQRLNKTTTGIQAAKHNAATLTIMEDTPTKTSVLHVYNSTHSKPHVKLVEKVISTSYEI